MKRLVAPGFVEEDAIPEIAGDHRQLADALKNGNGELAAEISFRHIATFRDMTLDKVMRSIRRQHELSPLAASQRKIGGI